MYSETEIRNGVVELVANITERPPDQITDTADFINDLGVDSLMAMEIMVGMGKKYRVDIPEAEFTSIRNVSQAVAAVQRHAV